MKNTLKPLPSFTAACSTSWKFARELERELSELRKDKDRLDWLIDNNCEIYEPDTALLFCDCDRESIDEMMEESTR